MTTAQQAYGELASTVSQKKDVNESMADVLNGVANRLEAAAKQVTTENPNIQTGQLSAIMTEAAALRANASDLADSVLANTDYSDWHQRGPRRGNEERRAVNPGSDRVLGNPGSDRPAALRTRDVP